jgi:protein TonB
MDRQLFAELSGVVSPPSTGRWYTVPLSVAAHVVLLVGVVAVPLVASGALPLPSAVMIFTTPAPPPPAPDPPAPTTHAVTPVVDPAINHDAAPLEAPSEILPDAPRPAPDLFRVPGPLAAPSDVGAARVVLALPPPSPRPLEPLRVGGNIREPAKIRDVRPVYPSIARAARVEGTVVIEATIRKDGSVGNAVIVQSVPLLNEAALSAVREWRYSIPTLNGEPVEVLMTVRVRFALQ